ncbi:hypothetical protein HO173_001527 [Letharia columbiana]|uniref:Uncharacterized protein n=1 Tax=Letharia columbiana TaxID=112416 RepID=A0A8H6G3J3_9LECA|nr:uncharacterized protein HO173_001527 [Letharia columbiana]KAF6239919.1 hypothetical protein HO173_001527 [Letharia columbiana]
MVWDQMMLSSKYTPSAALFLLLRLDPCSSLAIERSINLPASQPNSTQTSPNHCGFTGNSDLYGIGIRLGYYTQALSVWFANYFVLSEAKVLRSVNLLFLVALFIALAWLSHQAQQTYAIEVFLLLRLLFATWYVGVLDRSRFSKKHGTKRIVRVVVRECALLGMLGYTVWFAWTGLDRTEETPCGTWIFFAAKLNLYGTYRSAYKVLSISALSFGTIKQCDTAFQLFQHWRNTDIRSPDYFARLRQALLLQHYHNDISSDDSCNVPHPHRRSAEVGHPVRNSESAASSPPHPNVLIRDDEDEDASTRSVRSNNSASIQSDTIRQKVSDAATQRHLPATPPRPPKNPHTTSQNGSPTAHDPTLNDLPSLDNLIEADRWLEAITAVDVADHSAWCYQLPGLPMRIFLPPLHPPKRIQQRISALYALRPFRLPVLIPLARHVRSLCRFGWYNYPIMLEAALRDPCHKRISRSTLLTTIALHKAQLPTGRPTPHTVWNACVSLAMCVELILSIELSIYWNHIGGMGNVGAPGQLIPAIIGIGGLVKVVWIWWSRDDAVEEVDDGVGKELRECVAVYQRLREERGDLTKNEQIATTVAAKL